MSEAFGYLVSTRQTAIVHHQHIYCVLSIPHVVNNRYICYSIILLPYIIYGLTSPPPPQPPEAVPLH